MYLYSLIIVCLLDVDCMPDLLSCHGLDQIMLPACLAVFWRSLDARLYCATGEVSTTEQDAQLEAKNKWVQLMHYVAAKGWVKWVDRQEGGDDDMEEDEDGMEGSHNDGSTHPLKFLDQHITDLLPHPRYRALTFYLLNFACSVFCLCLDRRRLTSPMDINLEGLAKRLLEDIEQFLGTSICDVLADLLLDIIDSAKAPSKDFDDLWPTLEMDELIWVPEENFSCIGSQVDGSAKGMMWSIAPESCLMKEVPAAAAPARILQRKTKKVVFVEVDRVTRSTTKRGADVAAEASSSSSKPKRARRK